MEIEVVLYLSGEALFWNIHMLKGLYEVLNLYVFELFEGLLGKVDPLTRSSRFLPFREIGQDGSCVLLIKQL